MDRRRPLVRAHQPSTRPHRPHAAGARPRGGRGRPAPGKVHRLHPGGHRRAPGAGAQDRPGRRRHVEAAPDPAGARGGPGPGRGRRRLPDHHPQPPGITRPHRLQHGRADRDPGQRPAPARLHAVHLPGLLHRRGRRRGGDLPRLPARRIHRPALHPRGDRHQLHARLRQPLAPGAGRRRRGPGRPQGHHRQPRGRPVAGGHPDLPGHRSHRGPHPAGLPAPAGPVPGGAGGHHPG